MGVLEEARVPPPNNAFVVRVQLDVDKLLMVGSCNGNGGLDMYFNRCVNGG